MSAGDQRMPEPVTWAEHDRAHERSRPYSRTGGNDSRAYVLDASGWPDVLRCGQCGQHVQPRQLDDPPSFLNRGDDTTTTTRKATT